ncbi:hypothetical protein KP509_08G029700 [Ceratopteris richardii]|uniref:JmjC domain-containing protein n=1 Tax=Ceratopteris richardii TaxID=49495 RepID=A0A8T2UC22_CERRI|nr:hypothetical protein KP509_08G029700 [Ceratopteris richardii]
MIEVENSGIRRSKRRKVQIDYSGLLALDDECIPVGEGHTNTYRNLARAVLQWPDNSSKLAVVSPENLSSFVHNTGFHAPCVVRQSSATAEALGIRLPRGKLTVRRLCKILGKDHPVNTIDVATQLEGPVYDMGDWVSYFYSSAPRKRLLNVVSLDLAETPLENMVSVPSIVRELDLVSEAWPHNDNRSPKVQLYALMSVANCYTDFHIDFGGSSVWYHVLSGHKVFLLAPPSKGNLLMFEEWASSEKQASISFAHELAADCQKIEVFAGDTLFIPGGWPHCVATPMDSLVIGGNFLTGYNMRLQFDIWHMEERLKVRRKFRYPFYKPLMWYTASYYLSLLKKEGNETKRKVLSVWEREGIRSLCTTLQCWIEQSVRSGEVPDCIHDPNALLKDLQDIAKVH